LDCCCVDETLLDVADDPLAASRLLIEHLLPDPTHQNQYQYQPITRTPARAETNSGRIRTHRTGVGGGRGSGHGVEARSEDARSSGREGRLYIRLRRGDGMDWEEDEDATAPLQLELSRAIADIAGG
jgi:hypothetical protein